MRAPVATTNVKKRLAAKAVQTWRTRTPLNEIPVCLADAISIVHPPCVGGTEFAQECWYVPWPYPLIDYVVRAPRQNGSHGGPGYGSTSISDVTKTQMLVVSNTLLESPAHSNLNWQPLVQTGTSVIEKDRKQKKNAQAAGSLMIDQAICQRVGWQWQDGEMQRWWSSISCSYILTRYQ